MPLKFVEKGKGFAVDYRAPNPDVIALKYAYKWFGDGVVDRVRETKRRSITTADNIRDDILEYDRQYVPRTRDPVYCAVLESVRKDFTPEKEKLIPYTLGRVQKSSLPKTKSPGLPWKELGFKTKGEVLENKEACDRMHREWSLIGKGYNVELPETLIYFRAQICGIDANKIRGTWGIPFTVILEEARFVYPYLDWIRHSKRDVPVAYGVEMATGGMGYVDQMWENMGEGAKAVMMDWKRFDKTIPAWLIRDAFSIVAQCFEMNKVLDSENLVWNVDPKKTERRWRRMIKYFINTPFILPSGEKYIKDGGVPSGSAFTNLIDTIVNAIVTRYVVYHTTGELPKYDMYMGDDSIFMMKRAHVNLEDMAKLADETFGMIVNVAKSYITSKRTNINFLGYYNYHGFPIREEDFLIASFIYPERYHEEHDPMFTAMRALGQMWSTLNGVSAMRWLDIVTDIERTYGFDQTWYESFIAEHPGTLKFLTIIGIDSSKLYVPRRPGWKLDEVEPPLRSNRTPKRRETNVELLFEQFKENFVDDEEHFARFTDERQPKEKMKE